MDQHSRYRELIAARLDQPLTRVELRALNSHLKKCAACKEVDTEYREQRGLLRGLAAPIPPRDMWARTSASLDREVARAYRTQKWRRRLGRGRSAQPSTALMTAVAAIGVSAAIVVLQLAPAFTPATAVAPRSTPLSIAPQQIAWLGQGPSDMAVYQTDVSQVCPVSGPLDCISSEQFVRTPLRLPADMKAGTISLNPNGNQLAVVGHLVGEDVIAVVTMPDSDSSQKGDKPDPAATDQAGVIAEKTHDSNSIGDPQPAQGPTVSLAAGATPPASAIPGLAVLSILDNVQSAGAPPDWSPNGSMLAFSAMPDDGSTGPDVYVWSPGDAKAQPITNDHESYFASWSGNRIVISRISQGASKLHDFVIDPATSEVRSVVGPQLWLPTVDHQRVQAIGWYGQLDTSGTLPVASSGALYIIDWRTVDPFGTTPLAPGASATPQPTDAPSAEPTDTPDDQPTPTADQTPTAPAATATPTQSANPSPSGGETASPDGSGSPSATHRPTASTSESGTPDASSSTANAGRISASPSAKPSATATASATATPVPTATAAPTDTPAPAATATPAATAAPTATPAPTAPPVDSVTGIPTALIPLEPDRDPRAAPVVDWQARWSSDGEVLGVWIADSAGSSWGRLAVLAADPATEMVTGDNQLIPMTLARRGFTLGANRVAWVGPSEDNVDGELRIRTWGADGDGGLRLRAPDQEEVTPAS